MKRARDMTAMLQAPAAAESLFRTFTVGAHADALRENFYRCRRRAPMHEWPLVGLWLRSNSTLPPSALSLSSSTIEVVVASCQNDLWWLRFPLEPAQLAAFRLSLTRTTVYLKCGHRPSGARAEWGLRRGARRLAGGPPVLGRPGARRRADRALRAFAGYAWGGRVM